MGLEWGWSLKLPRNVCIEIYPIPLWCSCRGYCPGGSSDPDKSSMISFMEDSNLFYVWSEKNNVSVGHSIYYWGHVWVWNEDEVWSFPEMYALKFIPFLFGVLVENIVLGVSSDPDKSTIISFIEDSNLFYVCF